ncbi:Inosine/uridine-preferring nucleoside hydrolase domain-containing protein [Crepidotus variabilis]|uniref:Inosine/uridine-preferring nucleoside hydrolase domain-containing protein n=1 Tax=Crepidotus variabilis TaxID=179855 RepID=A0A9P6EGL7_9AGAR|nr:Inosine/uridine-preferring nucleoside hydrolase domain-containing protein [Crepidotus variabilis]
MSESYPIPVIIDTDPGVDDTIAILLALASPEINIEAFIACFGQRPIYTQRAYADSSLNPGNSDLEANYVNILKLYQAVHVHLEKHPDERTRFPNFSPDKKPTLAKGASVPLRNDANSTRTAQYFHGRDGLGDITSRHPEHSIGELFDPHPYLNITQKSGVDVALDILRSQPPRSVTYIVLGPMTNLAQMMRRDGQLVRDRIGRIVSMGGALDVPGNVSPVAEFNYYADPHAVKELLTSTKGLPLERFMMLPLDITTPHELPFPLYQEKIDLAFRNASVPSLAFEKNPITHFTSSFLERTRDVMLEFGKDAMELHDIVAVWCAIVHRPFPEDKIMTLAEGWRAHARAFEVECSGDLTRGMLVVDRREDVAAYPLGTIRSEAQREPHKDQEHEKPPATEIDKADMIDIVTGSAGHFPGVITIYKTPGPRALLEILFKRIWGIKL